MQRLIKQASCLAACLVLVVNMSTAQNWLTSLEEAKVKAQQLNQPIVLVFQGSDWCAPCIKMDRNIWSSETLINYAEDHLVLLKADFPRRKKNQLSEALQEQNNRLAEQYNTNGYFPFVVVLDEKGTVLNQAGYSDLSPDQYISTFLKPFERELSPTQGLQSYSRTLKLMGSRFDITLVADNAKKAEGYIDRAVAEIKRIEQLISSWDQHSQTTAINNNAGKEATVVDQELYALIERSIRLSSMTDGAFDISFASMDRIWTFDGQSIPMPDKKLVAKATDKIGYQNIELNSDVYSVSLKQEGMKIGFGAIGKGYAADKAKALLQELGVVSGIINASGDMNTWGTQPNGEAWSIGITNPLNKAKVFATFPLDDGAVATSGNYEKYVMIEGERYAHIIDPRTGYPTTGIISTTVFAPKAELADALATTLFVMGIDAGIDRIDQLPGIECIIVDEEGKVHTSQNIKIDQNDY